MARAYKALPPASELWERFEYKPLTGELIYIKASGKAAKGSSAGCAVAAGYRVIRLGSSPYKMHRLVWLWITGTDPTGLEVDHINGSRGDNRCNNLRLATSVQNKANRTASSPKGYTRRKGGRYFAKIVVAGTVHDLGHFAKKEEAATAYRKASLELNGEFSGVAP